MFFLYLSTFFQLSNSYLIVDDYHIPIGSKQCCEIDRKITNYSIIKHDILTKTLVSISPKLQDAIQIFRILNKNGISAQISETNSTYNIIPSNFIKTDDIRLYNLLSSMTVHNIVVSTENCKDVQNICKSQKRNTVYFLSIIFTFILIPILVMKIDIKTQCCLYDSNLQPKFALKQHLSKEEKTSQYESLSAVHLTGHPQLSIISLKREYPSARFRKVIAYPTQNNDYICFVWSENFIEKDDLNIKITATSDELKAVNIEYIMKNYRHYRPFRVKIEFDTSTIITLEIPWSVLQPFLPRGCSTTMVDASLLQCNNVVLSNNFKPTDFQKVVEEYSATLHFQRTVIFDDEGKIVMNYADQTLVPLSEAELQRIYKSLKDDNEYVAFDLLPDSFATVVRKGDGDVILIGIEEDQMAVARSSIPMVGLAALFIRQITLTREKLTKYDRFLHLMEQSKVFTFI